MESRQGHAGLNSEPSGSAGGFRRRFFGVAFERRTYAVLFYLLLGLPLAIASWVALVVMLAVGGALAVTVVGIPLLLVAMFGWCFYADLERLLSNTLLGTTIRPLPFGSERDTSWPWARLKARLMNAYTWRSLVYLLLVRFPMGIAGFVIVTSTIGFVIPLFLSPIHVAFDADHRVAAWTIDTYVEAPIAMLVAVLLMFPSLHIIRFAGVIAARINTAILQSPETETPQPWGDALDRAATAAVAWPGVWAESAREAGRGRRIQTRIWSAHFGLYLFVMLVLLVINGLTSSHTPWVLWPAWGWGIALALHTGYLVWGHLGGHLLAFALTNIGFFVIDAKFAESTWFFWPLVAWAIALATHGYLYFGFAPVSGEPLLEYDDQPLATPPPFRGSGPASLGPPGDSTER